MKAGWVPQATRYCVLMKMSIYDIYIYNKLKGCLNSLIIYVVRYVYNMLDSN